MSDQLLKPSMNASPQSHFSEDKFLSNDSHLLNEDVKIEASTPSLTLNRISSDYQSKIKKRDQQIKFFKEKDIKDTYFTDIVQSLKYEHFMEGEIVFNFGDYGDKFYIILQGSVSVILPFYIKESGEIMRTRSIDKRHSTRTITRAVEQQSSPKTLEKQASDIQQLSKDDSQLMSLEDQVKSFNNEEQQDNISQNDNNKNSVTILIDKVENDFKSIGPNSEQHSELKLNKLLSQPLDPPKTQNQFSIIPHQTLEKKDTLKSTSKHYTEVAQLSSGSAFGELALQTASPRQATIKCLTDCVMASMSREDYNRILAKIDIKSKEEQMLFFQQTPYFCHMSKSQILKLLVCFHPMKLNKDQVVLWEGEKSKYLYLIKDGEFELSKKIKQETKAEMDYVQFGGKPDTAQKSKQSSQNKLSSMQFPKQSVNNDSDKNKSVSPMISPSHNSSKINEHKFMYLGRGQIFGEECFLIGCQSLYTIRCKSAHSEVFIINELEFAKKIKNNDLAIRVIKSNCDQKAHQVAQTLLTDNSYLNQDQGKTSVFVYQNDKDTSQVVEQNLNFYDLNEQYRQERKDALISQQIKDKIKINSQQDSERGMKLFQSPKQAAKQAIQRNALLNKRELDFRETMREIVNHYPSVSQQRRIVKKEFQNKLQQVNEMMHGSIQSKQKDPQIAFQELLADTLSKNTNKRELINILKRKLVNVCQTNAQDHLKLLDKFLQSKLVKRYTQAQKKHYISSKITEAIEKTEGIEQFFEISESIKKKHEQQSDFKIIDKKHQRVMSQSNQRKYDKFQSPMISNQQDKSHSGINFSFKNSMIKAPMTQMSVRDRKNLPLNQSTVAYSQVISPKNTNIEIQKSQYPSGRINILSAGTQNRYHHLNKSMATDREFNQILSNSQTRYMNVASTMKKHKDLITQSDQTTMICSKIGSLSSMRCLNNNDYHDNFSQRQNDFKNKAHSRLLNNSLYDKSQFL